MPDRFYAPGRWEEVVELPETEAHHFARVLRGKAGDSIELFNGHGMSGLGDVESVTKRSVLVRLKSMEQEPERLPPVVIAAAAPKGDRLSLMIEKLTELGVDRWIPLKTVRSVVDPGEQKLHKLSQTVIAACKQSRRSRLMAIDSPCALEELQQHLGNGGHQLWLGAAGASAFPSTFNSAISQKTRVGIVGPEGGLTLEEVDLLKSWGALPVSLGPYILRIETAALAFAAHFAGFSGRTVSSP